MILFILSCAVVLQGQTGEVTTVLGPTVPPATSSIEPMGVAFDSLGNLYTADIANCVVWKTTFIQGAPVTSVFAGEVGNCAPTSSTASPDPTANSLNLPTAVTVCNNNVYIASHGVDHLLTTGIAIPGNVVEVNSAGAFSNLGFAPNNMESGNVFPIAIACSTDSSQVDHVWLSSYGYSSKQTEYAFFGELDELSPNGGGGWTTTESRFWDDQFALVLTGLAVDANGFLYGLSAGADAEGWTGPGTVGSGGIIELLDTSDPTSSCCYGSVDKNSFFQPSGLSTDAAGNWVVSEAPKANFPTQLYSSQVERVDHSGNTNSTDTETVLAGNGTLGFVDDVPGTQAELNAPQGTAVDASGNVYIADAFNNRVRRFRALASGPGALALVNPNAPAIAPTFGYQQSVLNPTTGLFYYVSSSNTISVIGTGADVLSQGVERNVAVIPVGAQHAGGSQITLIADPTRNLIYANNYFDGNLYVIDGAPDQSASPTAYQVIASVPLKNPDAYLLAIDTTLNRIYVAGPNAVSLSVVQGGTAPQLLQNIGYPAAFIASLGVYPGNHNVYAVSNSGAGPAFQEESLITVAYDAGDGSQNTSNEPFPSDESILYPDFIANSLSVDPQTGSLLVAGVASLDPLGQTYQAEDLFHLTPDVAGVDAVFTYTPITTSLDAPDRTFYITDAFPNSPSSHAAMVTGMDNQLLVPSNILLFGSGAIPPAPTVYDIEPDTSSYQAWLSASDSKDGGFLKIWDARTQTLPVSIGIPNNGGGVLTIDSSLHAAYLMDVVNDLLYLVNTPLWTPTPSPSFTRNGATVTITASNTGDTIYYNTDGIPAWFTGAGQTICASPCEITLSGTATTINAIERAPGGNEPASDDVFVSFTTAQPTSMALVLASGSVSAGASDSATATVTPASGVTSVNGSVSFTIQAPGSSTAIALCSPAPQLTANNGVYQAVCNFTAPTTPTTYTITATFAGDTFNQGSSNTASLTVGGGASIPGSGSISPTLSPVAINQNNSGASYNAFVNSDSSLGLLQNGAIVTGQSCPAFTTFPQLNASSFSSVSSGAVYVDAPNNRIYLAMMTNVGAFLAYESINKNTGACTQSVLVPAATEFNNPTSGTVEMNVDPVQGNLYLLVATEGGEPDALYVVPTPTALSPWTGATAAAIAALQLDYSASYGPIVIDSSTHAAFINDLGASIFGPPGTTTSSGFFVYDPNHSTGGASPSHLEWVVGYLSGNPVTTTSFDAAWLMTDNAGKVFLANENPSGNNGPNLATPLTILDTKSFSFFSGTQSAGVGGGKVDIAPGAGLSAISAVTQYTAIGGADIDAATDTVYVFGYPYSVGQLSNGYLLAYNASSGETVLNANVPEPLLYDAFPPWGSLAYNPFSTGLAVTANAGGSGGLGATSAICAGIPVAFAQLLGNEGNPTATIGTLSVNATTGYEYAVQPPNIENFGDTTSTFEFISPPAGSCTTTLPNPVATTTNVVAAPTSAVAWDAVVLTATVAPVTGTGTPVGTVSFTTDDGTVIPSGSLPAGTATTSSLTPGVRTITATYISSNTGSFTGSHGTTQVTIQPQPPVFSPPAGGLLPSQKVTITAATGANVYYTTSGLPPTTGSTLYATPISVTGTSPVTIEAIAVVDGISSVPAIAVYTPLPSQLAVAPGWVTPYYNLASQCTANSLQSVLDKNGNYFELCLDTAGLFSLTPSGASAQFSTTSIPFDGLAVGPDGATLYVSTGDSHVWSLLPQLSGTGFAGSIQNLPLTFPSTATDSLSQSGALAWGSPQQHLFVVDQKDRHILEFDQSGKYLKTLYDGPSLTNSAIYSLAVDSGGDLYFAVNKKDSNGDIYGVQLVEIPAGGVPTNLSPTFAGPGLGFQLNSIDNVTLDAAGNLYFDGYNAELESSSVSGICKLDSSGNATVIAGTGQFTLGNAGSASSFQLNFPTAFALNSQGQMYIGQSSSVYLDDTLNATVLLGAEFPTTEPIAFYNPYAESVTLNQIAITGTNAADFQLGSLSGCSATSATTFMPGASCTGTVTVSPAAAAQETASLTLSFAGGATETVSLSGALIDTTSQLSWAGGSPLSGIPANGIVQVTAPASSLATPLPANGTATLTDTYTAAGSSAPTVTSYTVPINAVASVTLHGAGVHTLGCSYPGDANHLPSQCTPVPVTVTLQPLSFTWMTGPPIPLGTALGQTQLDVGVTAPGVTGQVPGTPVYTPPAGTLVNTLGSFPLSVQFTPNDQVDIAPGSATASVQVIKATPSIAFTPPVATYNAAETLTLTVTGVLGLVPTGSVTLDLDGTSHTVQVASSSAATSSSTYTYNAGILSGGQHSVVVEFNSDANYTTASAMEPPFTVGPAATSVTLASSSTSTDVNTPVTLTATVTSSITQPIPNSGTVEFYNGSTRIGAAMTSGSVATLSTSFATPGTFSLTAVYTDVFDMNFGSSTSPAILEVVATPDYTITVQPPSLTIVQGQTGTATFTVTSVGGYSTPVSFSCSGLLANTTCTFNPSTVTPTAAGATTTLTIQTDVAQAALSLPKRPGSPDSPAGLETLAGGSVLGALLLLIGFNDRWKELKRWQQRALQCALLAALLAGGLGIVSCGGGGPKTPIGQATVLITASGGAGGSSDVHTVSLSVNITQ